MDWAEDCSISLSLSNAVITVVFTVIFCLSALGNSVVIVTILKRQKRSVRSITNLYLLNLSVADLLRSVICMPPTLLSELSQCWLLGQFMCKIAAYLQPVAVCASAYTLAVIAVERYYAICRPLHSRKWHSKRHAVSMISFVWLFSFATNSGCLLLFDAVPYKTAWNCRSMASPLVDFFYQVYVTLILLLIPLAIMTGLYGNVIFTLKTGIKSQADLALSMHSLDCGNSTFYDSRIRKPNSGRGLRGGWSFDAVFAPNWVNKTYSDMSTNGISSLKVPGFVLPRSRTSSSFSLAGNGNSFHANRMMSVFSTTSYSFLCTSPRRSVELDSGYLLRSTHQEKILLAKRRVTRMLIILVIAFVFCWTPSYVWWLLIKTTDLVDAPSMWNNSLNTMITVLTYISTCTNPITYCFMNASFRMSVFKHCICCPKTCFQQRAHRNLGECPQRRRTQSATPRVESENGGRAVIEQEERSSKRLVAACDGLRPVPEIEVQFFGSQSLKQSSINKNLAVED